MTTNVLTNITLGVDIADTCNNNEIAIKSCLQFDFTKKKKRILWEWSFGTGCIKIPDTVVVVGPRKSIISKSIATLTNLFDATTISYGSTELCWARKIYILHFLELYQVTFILLKPWFPFFINWNETLFIWFMTIAIMVYRAFNYLKNILMNYNKRKINQEIFVYTVRRN